MVPMYHQFLGNSSLALTLTCRRQQQQRRLRHRNRNSQNRHKKQNETLRRGHHPWMILKNWKVSCPLHPPGESRGGNWLLPSPEHFMVYESHCRKNRIRQIALTMPMMTHLLDENGGQPPLFESRKSWSRPNQDHSMVSGTRLEKYKRLTVISTRQERQRQVQQQQHQKLFRRDHYGEANWLPQNQEHCMVCGKLSKRHKLKILILQSLQSLEGNWW